MQTTALTAGECAHALLLVGAVEIEATAIGTAGHLELAHVQDVQAAGDVFPHGFLIGQVVAVLVHEGHLHGLADLDLAGIGLLATGNHLEQCGFTRAVGADDAHDGARRNLEAQVVDQHAVAKGLGDVGELDHFLAQAVRHGDEDFVGFVALLVFEVAQLFKTGQAGLALGLARFGVLAGPFQLFLQGFGAGLFTLLLCLQARLLLLQPVAVIAFVRNTRAAVHFQNPLGGVVQEVAVMGNGHHSARVALQKLLQPVHRFGVQVVGRLVEQEHVGLGQEQAAQGHAAFFTAGEHADVGVPRRQAQRVSGNFQLMFRISSGGGDDGFQLRLLCSECVKVGVFVAIGGVHLFQTRFGREDFAHTGFHAFAHGLGGVQLGFLGQVADVQARHGDGFALDLFVQTGHDFQERGLARAVGAQHADLGAGEKAE